MAVCWRSQTTRDTPDPGSCVLLLDNWHTNLLIFFTVGLDFFARRSLLSTNVLTVVSSFVAKGFLNLLTTSITILFRRVRVGRLSQPRFSWPRFVRTDEKAMLDDW